MYFSVFELVILLTIDHSFLFRFFSLSSSSKGRREKREREKLTQRSLWVKLLPIKGTTVDKIIDSRVVFGQAILDIFFSPSFPPSVAAAAFEVEVN